MTAFIAVVDNGGFASAAKKLGLSPSAATRLVASLEQRLGTRLLNRTTRSISLTDVGTRFLESSRRILSDVADAEQIAEHDQRAPTGKLVVTAPQVFGRMHIAPLLCNFMGRFPDVQVELRLSDAEPNLVEEGIDLAVRIGALADSTEVVRRIGSTKKVLVASPTYLERRGTPQHPRDLRGHLLISNTALCRATSWTFLEEGESVDIAVIPRYVTNSVDAALWHSGNHGGLTLALSYEAEDHLKHGSLVTVLTQYETEVMPIQYVYSSSRLLSKKVRAFIDMTQETCVWDFAPSGAGG